MSSSSDCPSGPFWGLNGRTPDARRVSVRSGVSIDTGRRTRSVYKSNHQRRPRALLSRIGVLACAFHCCCSQGVESIHQRVNIPIVNAVVTDGIGHADQWKQIDIHRCHRDRPTLHSFGVCHFEVCFPVFDSRIERRLPQQAPILSDPLAPTIDENKCIADECADAGADPGRYRYLESWFHRLGLFWFTVAWTALCTAAGTILAHALFWLVVAVQHHSQRRRSRRLSK